jgi:phage gpG-like protein
VEILAELLGEKVVHRRLVDVGRRATNMAPALREVARLWMDLEQDVFASEGASGGKPWAPLAGSTQETKARAGYSSKILQAEGGLMASLTQPGAADQILEVDDDMLVFGTGHPAGAFHGKGTSRMPARPPIQISPQGRRQTVKILQRFVVTGDVGRSL